MEPIPDLFWTPPAPKFGAVPSLIAGAEQGLDSSLTFTAGRALSYKLADIESKEPPITEAQFNQEFAIEGGPKWRQGMSRTTAKLMLQHTVDDRLNQSLTTGHPTASLVGNLAGGMAADLPLNLVLPELKVVGVEARMMKAGARFGGRVANTAATGAYQGAVQTGGLAILSPYAGTEYTMEQAAMDLAGTAVISTAMGLGHGANSHVNKSWKDTVSDAYFTRASQGDDISPDIAKLFKAQDPAAQQAAELASKAKAGDSAALVERADNTRNAGFIPRDMEDLAAGEARQAAEAAADMEPILRAEAELRAKNGGAGDTAMARGDYPRDPTQADYEAIIKNQEAASKKEAAGFDRKNRVGPGFRERRALGRQMAVNAELERGNANIARRQLVEKESYVPKTDDEKFLADLWKKSFGVDLRFFNEATSLKAGVYGLIHNNTPSKAYVRSGLLHGGADSMVAIAGHELGHSIRLRDTALWTSITESILDAHDAGTGKRDPMIREAYRSVVAAMDSETNLSPWHGLSKGAKVDEVMATILGRAMESKDFWTTLYNKSPRGAATLKAKLLTLARAVAGASDPKSKGLAAAIGRQIAASDIKDRADSLGRVRANARVWTEGGPLTRSQRLDIFYSGRAMRMIEDLHALDLYESYRRGGAKGPTFVEVDAIIDDLAPVHTADGRAGESGFTDRSGSPVEIGAYDTVVSGKAIAGDPRLWALKNIFRNSKEGTPERAIFDKWKAGAYAQGKGGWQDLGAAMRESPLMKITDHGDGTYDIHVIRNDDHPKWWENREGFDYKTDPASLLAEQASAIESELRKFAIEVQRGRGATDEKLAAFAKNWDEADGLDGLIVEFAHTPGASESIRIAGVMVDETLPSAEASSQARQAFLLSFREFIAEKMDRFRLAADEENYRNLHDRYREVDLLAKFEEDEPGGKVDLGPKESHQDALRAATVKLDDAMAVILKKGREQADGTRRKISDYTLEQGSIRDGKFDQEVARVRKLWREDVEQMLLDYNDAWFDLHGEDVVSADDLTPTIERLTDLKMDQTIPNWRKAEEIKKVVEGEHFDSLDSLKEQGLLNEENELVRRGAPDPDEADSSFMSRLPNETDEQLAVRARDEMIKEVDRLRLTARQAGQLVRERLVRDHAKFAPFLKDYEQSSTRSLTEAIQELGLASEPSADGKPKAPGKLSEDLAELSAELDHQRTYQQLQYDTLDQIATGAFDQKSPVHRAVMDRLEWAMHFNKDDPRAAMDWVRRDIVMETNSAALGAVGAYKGRTRIKNQAKKSLDHAYSGLDGLARKGVQGSGDSVAALKAAMRDSDTAPLAGLLDELGLKTAWEDNRLIKDLEEQHKGTGKNDPMIKQLAELIALTRDMQAGRLNSLGARIMPMEKGDLWSVVHNAQRIKLADEFSYAADMMRMVDLEATERLHGPNTVDAKGSPVFDAELFFKQMHHETTDPKKVVLDGDYDPNTDGGNLANQVSRHKTVIFKPGEAFNYDMKYGSGDTASLIFSQIGRRAEVGALMTKFGFDYKKTWSRSLAEIGGDQKYSWSKLGRIDMTFKMLTGELDHPVNQTLAVFGKAMRDTANAAVAWMSGVSSVTDFGNMAAELRFVGGSDVSYGDMVGALGKRVSALKNGGGEHDAFLQGMGMGLRSVVGNYARLQDPVGGLLGSWSRAAQKASDITFKYSGLEASGRAQQGAHLDNLTRIIGDQAKRGKISPEFENWLKRYNITPEAFKRMAVHAADIDGLEGTRLSPDMIHDSADALALRIAMRDSLDYAVLQPSISTEALLRLGTKDGTVLGVAARAIGHFKGYPIDMVRRITRRFDNGYSESFWAWDGGPNRAQKEKLIWATTMIGLAATAVSLKDMLRGREPLNPFDGEQWNMANLTRVVSQAGVGPLAAIEQYASPRQLAGPSLGIAGQLAGGLSDLVTGENNGAYSATNAVFCALPLASLAPVQEARKAVLGSLFPQALGAPFQHALVFREQETGQSSIYRDGP